MTKNEQTRFESWIASDAENRDWNRTSLLMTLPLLVLGVYAYGAQALRLAAIAAGTAFLLELIAGKIVLRRVTATDWNAVVTGLWIACMLPPQISPWFAVAGVCFAVLVVKIPFGGFRGAPFVP
ncbi:MAG: RnfABCDGE type electron transport complex subunit D, partial [Oscillospiraceae bacterium]|nr:RnfABCDGE type electron transport complex subunit D [Oscillospiraceae bacterium]